MATYISLLRFTQQGIENIKESPARLDRAKEAFRAMGAEIKEFCLVAGRYDAVVISEAPDGETAAKLALAISSAGAIRTETLRAFPEGEYRKIIAGRALSTYLVHPVRKHWCASLKRGQKSSSVRCQQKMGTKLLNNQPICVS